MKQESRLYHKELRRTEISMPRVNRSGTFYLSTHRTPRRARLLAPTRIGTATQGHPCLEGSEKKHKRLESPAAGPWMTTGVHVSMTSHEGV